MIQPATIGWFAAHEARLSWRDWLSLMTAGRRRRTRTVVLGFLTFVAFTHGLAWLMLGSVAGIAGTADTAVLAAITGTLLLAWSLMLSQAMESVTRAFYARGDLELILTAPVAASRLFAVRIVAMAMTIVVMALTMAAPFIDVLAWRGGAHWLGGYAVVVALSMAAVAAAVAITVALFRAIGPRRTRAVAQIVAAVVGAGFAIVLQFVAIVSYGTTSRLAVLHSSALVRRAPDAASPIWLPAHAVLGEPAAVAALLGLGGAALAAAIWLFAPRFGGLALAAGMAHGPARSTSPATLARPRSTRLAFLTWKITTFRDRLPPRNGSPSRALRRKEWMLLLRDPWLLSQTLMQLLYLLPAAFILWRGFRGGNGVSALLVPILIVTAGQLGGGLAWLAVSGEDAPELIATAPVSAVRVLRAKAEAVLGGIAAIFGPFIALLAIDAPLAALVTCAGVAVAAGSAIAIQYWFRTQARRSLFRRRQTSSRIATFAEALSSTLWAGTGALAAAGTWFAIVPAVLVVAIIAGAWLISPDRNERDA